MPSSEAPELFVTVFSDYICPFCYIGDLRLARLREEYRLRVNWCLMEIHPETNPHGAEVEGIGYSPEQWAGMRATLQEMAAEEGIDFHLPDRVANSRKALLLAEAAKQLGPDIFYRLHGALFRACFDAGLDIGNETELKNIAADAGVPEGFAERAWQAPGIATRLQHHRRAAQELKVDATPTFFIGEQRVHGAVATQTLREAAQIVLGTDATQ